MTDAQGFFVSDSVARVRELKLSKSVLFLRGMMESVEDEDIRSQIGPIYISLSESDRQLELIQLGQLKLDLPVDGKAGDP
jgi:hypothetical protein